MVQDFFSKAKHNLTAAMICFENGLYDAATNRAYYAAFQATVAMLAHRGYARERLDHKWVQAEFNRRLVHREKAFPSKVKSFLAKMQYFREMADYKPERIGKKVAGAQISRAEEMIRLIGEALKDV